MLRPRDILVPTDFSVHSDKALIEALDLARDVGARIHLLHVIHEEIPRCIGDYCLGDIGLSPSTLALVDQVERELSTGAVLSLRRQLEKFAQAREVEVITEVRKGIPAEEILKAQDELGIDLIVISPLGRTGLVKYSIGNVARNVVRGARVPVLVIR